MESHRPADDRAWEDANDDIGPDESLRRVFIVEDEHVARRTLATLLRSEGYEPVAFSSAEDAIGELSAATGPAVALLDVDLPGMSGLDLLRHLQRTRPAIRPILVTAVPREDLGQDANTPQTSYLQKPIQFTALLRLLRSNGLH